MNWQSLFPPAPPAGSPAADNRVASRTITGWLKGLTVLAVGSWLLLGLHMLPRNSAETESPGTAPDSEARSRRTRFKYTSTGKAPWGRLQCMPITISPPPELVARAIPLSSREVQWHFPNTISARLPALFSEIGLSEPLREKLVSLAEINPEISGVTIHPTREIVLGLDPKERSALYTVLCTFRENQRERNAFRFCGSSLDEWIGDLPLLPETRKLIEPLVYRHGSFLFFADLTTIEQSFPSPEQRSLLAEALSQESTFLVRLEVSEESDLEELVDYWGRGGRARDVRPILQSLQRAEGKRSIDITCLLPPFARCRLYTYHVFSEEKTRFGRDCHWTTMNFFSEQPDDRFADVKEVTRTLKEDYYRVDGNLRLGDVVAFIDQTALIHTAVYVADDILFTKNGRGSATPWMLMKLQDMKYYYPRRWELEIQYYRRTDS